MPAAAHRLPHTVLPRRYDLELRVDIDAAAFSGEVGIDIDVLDATDRIVLHSLDLQLHDATLEVDGNFTPLECRDLAEHEQVELLAPHTIAAGTARLALRFDGTLNDQLVGFYRSTYSATGPDGAATEHTLAVTQFESTHARRAFPCFDEPAMKAVFAVTLVHDAELFSVANTAELDRVEQGDGTVRVRFADTISMSTYLVAFVIGALEATPPRLVDGLGAPVPLRVVHPPGQAALSGFALDVADAALRFFERYYEIPYPGDKVDLVAVPDFAFGAMENLGCITFREVLLLVDPDQSTQPELQRVADVINHELAHMWFGDLVTMKWWNGIWLNEAFATFMEITATDAFRPDWDVWTTFGLARAMAFDTDTLSSTRPIEYEVVTAADAEAMFDILTYEKGASVVRMLEQFLGAEVFRKGIARYLRTHAYANTDTSDLWDALEAESGQPVRRLMDRWIYTGGHPVVAIERVDDGLRVTQRQASFDVDATAKERWPVPIVARSSVAGEAVTSRWLLEDDTMLDLGGRPEWIQANVGGNGFYRVELDAALRRSLIDGGSLSPLERFVLIDDTWAGFLAGRVTQSDVIELIERCAPGETDPSVWRRLAAALGDLLRLVGEDGSAPMRQLALRTAGPALAEVRARLAEAADPLDAAATERDRDLRGVLFTVCGTTAASTEVLARAREVLASDEGDATLHAAAVAVVAANCTAEEHDELEQRWRNAATPQEELRYLSVLVDTDDADLFQRALVLAIEEVRTQNAPYLLRRAIDHRRLGPTAWRFVAQHWDTVARRFPSNSLPRMMEGIRGITDAATATDIECFVAATPELADSMQTAQHLERMRVGVAAARRVRAAS